MKFRLASENFSWTVDRFVSLFLEGLLIPFLQDLEQI